MGFLKSGLSLFWAFVLTALVVLSMSSLGEGVKQELILHTSNGIKISFDTNIPDLSDLGSTLSKVYKVCTNGVWTMFDAVNYGAYNIWLNQIPAHDNFICRNISQFSKLKSVRHWGASETTTSSLSLYSGTRLEGQEILVTARARTDILIPIRSLALSNHSEWMLFEGKSLDGKSACFKPPSKYGDFAYFDSVGFLGLATVGSVFRGCDSARIKLYKQTA